MSHVSSVKSNDQMFPVSPGIYLGTSYVMYQGNWAKTIDRYFNTGGLVRQYERCMSTTHPGPPYKCGGAFSHFKYEDGGKYLANSGTYFDSATVSLRKYVGGFVCTGSAGQNGLDVTDLSDIGTANYSRAADFAAEQYRSQAWRMYAPGKPLADAAVFIGELKDVPKMLRGTAKFFFDNWRERRITSRRAADAWLNTQFGWFPFLRDLAKFHNAWQNADRMIKHIRAYNNKWRKFGGPVRNLLEQELIGEGAYTKHSPTLESSFYKSFSGSTGSHKRYRNVSDLVWCSGLFRYWIPNINDVNWESYAKMQLYGLSVTPKLVWELTPWSWLIDWFATTDDFLSNADTGWAENLAASKAYCMRKRIESIRVESYHNLPGGAQFAAWDFAIESKGRAVMSPFGLGIDNSSLSSRQLSILAALGISRLG